MSPRSRLSTEELKSLLRQASSSNWPGLLTRGVFRQAVPSLVPSGVIYVLQILCALSTPVIINRLLLWIATESPAVLEGSLLIVALSAASIVGFFLNDLFERRVKYTGIRARAAVSGLLFQKALCTNLVDAQRLGESGGSSSGELHNLFGVDATALEDFFGGFMRLLLQVSRLSIFQE